MFVSVTEELIDNTMEGKIAIKEKWTDEMVADIFRKPSVPIKDWKFGRELTMKGKSTPEGERDC